MILGFLKFDKNWNFLKSWDGKGTEPGKFEVAHGVAIDFTGNCGYQIEKTSASKFSTRTACT